MTATMLSSIPPRDREGSNTPLPRGGQMAIDAGTVARIIQAQSSFDGKILRGHSLKRGALSTGMDRNVATFPRPASSGSAAAEPMRCSTNTSNSASL
jgi:hypothetical protein